MMNLLIYLQNKLIFAFLNDHLGFAELEYCNESIDASEAYSEY